MPKTAILEAIEKIRRSIREGESDARGVIESVRELWDELDLGLYDRRTLAIVGLVDLVGRALEKKSPSPEEQVRAVLEDLVKEGHVKKRRGRRGTLYSLAKARVRHRGEQPADDQSTICPVLTSAAVIEKLIA